MTERDKERHYPEIEEWAHKRVIPVPLGDDLVVDFRLPDLGVWIARGKIPNPLVPIAEQLDFPGIDVDKFQQLSAEERSNYFSLQGYIIATHLVRPNLMERFDHDSEAAQEYVLEEIPPEHRGQLWLAAFHISSELVQQLIDLAPFREERPSADVPGDSGAESPTSE